MRGRRTGDCWSRRATSVRRCGSSVKPLRDHADQPPPPELEEMTARGRNRDPCEAREFGWRMRGELAFGAWGGPGASLNHPRGAGTAWSPTRTRSLAVRAAGPIGRAPRRHAEPTSCTWRRCAPLCGARASHSSLATTSSARDHDERRTPNGGFYTRFGSSGGDSYRRAFRPSETFRATPTDDLPRSWTSIKGFGQAIRRVRSKPWPARRRDRRRGFARRSTASQSRRRARGARSPGRSPSSRP